jgi:hypothetical protein
VLQLLLQLLLLLMAPDYHTELWNIMIITEGWLATLPQNKYTDKVLDEIHIVAYEATLLVSSLPENGVVLDDPECCISDNFGDMFEKIKATFLECKAMVQNIQGATKVLKRNASGDREEAGEDETQVDIVKESQVHIVEESQVDDSQATQDIAFMATLADAAVEEPQETHADAVFERPALKKTKTSFIDLDTVCDTANPMGDETVIGKLEIESLPDTDVGL